jgi:hypothetical protein
MSIQQPGRLSERSALIAPDKVRPWHELVADMIICDPNRTQRSIAQELNRSEHWLSIVINCDAFQEYLATRKEEIVDPALRATVEERFRAVANLAAEKFLERLTLNAVSNKDLLDAMKVSSTGLGMGPSSKAPSIQQNLYVLPSPQRPTTSTEWAQIVENQVGVKQGE